MLKPTRGLEHWNIDQNWTLFLDRDGVINKLLPGDYVKSLDQFEILPGVPEAIAKASRIFGRIIVVTNQQGIGKGLMTVDDLMLIHAFLRRKIAENGGRIDAIYFSPHLTAESNPMRKPGIGMALTARLDFPEIEFSKCIMVGDSPSDMEFGQNAGMRTVFIQSNPASNVPPEIDFVCRDLPQFVKEI